MRKQVIRHSPFWTLSIEAQYKSNEALLEWKTNIGMNSVGQAASAEMKKGCSKFLVECKGNNQEKEERGRLGMGLWVIARVR